MGRGRDALSVQKHQVDRSRGKDVARSEATFGERNSVTAHDPLARAINDVSFSPNHDAVKRFIDLRKL